jgi:hypothetical protein
MMFDHQNTNSNNNNSKANNPKTNVARSNGVFIERFENSQFKQQQHKLVCVIIVVTCLFPTIGLSRLFDHSVTTRSSLS